MENIRGLHVLTDRKLVEPRTIFEVVKRIIGNGVSVIQLRDKNVPQEATIHLGRQLRRLTKNKCLFIVNDDVEVALEIEADGVHVGQNDMGAIQARQLLRKNMILGVSASTVQEAQQAEKDGADYIGAGPIFPTISRLDANPPIGLSGLKSIKNSVSIPVIAIGGIQLNNAAAVAQIADGIAVISAVLRAHDPKQVTQELSIIINSEKIY